MTTKGNSCSQVARNYALILLKTQTMAGIALLQKIKFGKTSLKLKKYLNFKFIQVFWLIDNWSQLLMKFYIRPFSDQHRWCCSNCSIPKSCSEYNKIFAQTTRAPWHIENHTLHNNLIIPSITDAIRDHAIKCRTDHCNRLMN